MVMDRWKDRKRDGRKQEQRRKEERSQRLGEEVQEGAVRLGLVVWARPGRTTLQVAGPAGLSVLGLFMLVAC